MADDDDDDDLVGTASATGVIGACGDAGGNSIRVLANSPGINFGVAAAT